jgi:hypothetical protein
MADTQDILISQTILLKAPRNPTAMQKLRDRLAARMQQAIEQVMSSEQIEWNWECTNFRYLESSSGGPDNAGRCFYCSSWATDGTKPDAIDGLMPGCELDGRWVCDQCIELHEQSTPGGIS